jgi:hypothetical protein
MKTVLILFALSLPLLVAFPCLAQDQNDNTALVLQEMCSRPYATVGNAYCVGFAHAAVSVLDGLHKVCEPDRVTAGEEAKVMAKYFNDHPEALHEGDALAAARAFIAAWPCKAEDSQGKR